MSVSDVLRNGHEPRTEQSSAYGLRRIHATNPYREFPASEVEQSIARRFERQVSLNRDRLALRTSAYDLTYDALNRWANRIAHSLARMAKPDAQAVPILLDHDAPLIAAILAVLKSGNFYVALEPSHPAERLRNVVENSQAELLITNSNHLSLARGIAGPSCSLLDLDTLSPSLSDGNLDLPIPSTALAHIVYTSGSTGKPKGVSHTHRNVLHNVRNYTNTCHLCATDRFALLTLCCFAPSVANIFGALLNGGAVLPFQVRERGVAELREWLRTEQISVYYSVPLVFRHLTGAVTDRNEFPHLRLIKLGGEAITRDDVDLFKRHFSEQCLLHVTLGASEVNVFRSLLIDKRTEFTGPIAPAGFAVEGMEVLLLDDHQQEVPAGETGEIAIKSSYLFAGYWRRPELTEAAFTPDPRGGEVRLFRTGDIGRMLPGGLLAYLGRRDFQIKIRGVRIEPAEVESALKKLPEVRDCVVMAREDGPGDTRLVAYLVAKTEDQPDPSTLRARLTLALPADLIPSAFVWLEQLPLTPNGKVNRKALPKPQTGFGEQEPAKNLLELKLVRVWQEIFQREHIGRHDNFFALGGHSLLATQLVAAIDHLVGCKLPISALFQSPTVASLARRLTEEDWAPEWSSLVPLQPLGSRPPLFLAHGVGGHLYWFKSRDRFFAPDQPVYGLQAVGLDGANPRHASVEEMAAHYAREIRSFQPEGPYHLGGYSLGGVIAFETAQQLYRLGQRVAFLALLDTSPRSAPWTVYARTIAPHLWLQCRFRFHRWWHTPHRDRLDYVRECWTRVRWWVLKNRSASRGVATAPEQKIPPLHALSNQDYYPAVASAYRFRRYPGSIDVFLSDSADARLTPFWSHLARGGATLHRLSGDHYQILERDHYPATAKALRAALNRAQAGAESLASRTG